MFALLLNDMRSPKVEMLTEVARAETREELEAMLESERVDHYRDGQWGKTFRKGGPLEWCNPPSVHRYIREIVMREGYA